MLFRSRAALTDPGKDVVSRSQTHGQHSTNQSGTAASRPAQERKELKRLEAEQRQARSRERKGQQQIVHRLEKAIAELESRQSGLTAELEKSETYEKSGAALRINRELTEVMDNLERLTAEWEQAASRLAELDAQ